VRAAQLDPLTLQGWNNAAPTYGAVARAILDDDADVGPGLRATAEQFGLDFVPLGEERFDFIVARSVFESRRGRALQEILHSKTWREYARTLPGYEISRSGRVIAEIQYGTRRKR
jgi:putative molybdopterin biosynthesis protein